MNELRLYIKRIIESFVKKELIVEPDLSEDDEEENEVSLASSIAGATTPLGTTATYPGTARRKKKKSPAEVAGRSFANAKKIR